MSTASIPVNEAESICAYKRLIHQSIVSTKYGTYSVLIDCVENGGKDNDQYHCNADTDDYSYLEQ